MKSIFITLCFLPFLCVCQEYPSDREFEYIKHRTENTFSMFSRDLERLASSYTNEKVKALTIASAKTRFKNGGYTTVQVSNKYKHTIKNYTLDQYLMIVSSYSNKYSHIAFSVRPYEMSKEDFIPTYQNGSFSGYTIIARYSQLFKAKTYSRPQIYRSMHSEYRTINSGLRTVHEDWDYEDITEKSLTIYVTCNQNMAHNYVTDIYLGDIVVIETH